MISRTESSPSLDRQLDDLLLHWQELRQQGRSLSAAELAAGAPELVEELQRRISALRSMEAILGLGGAQSEATDPARPPSTQPYSPGEIVGPHTAATQSIAGYTVNEVLGRGGMGVVYRARQLQPDRPVALKMILAGHHASLEQRTRFQREVEAVARLNHPNVVQIYEVGEHDGQPFFSMEYVNGGSLADRLTQGPIPAGQAAELAAVLAEAMAYAHAHGIIHRDLKPGNILLASSEQRSGVSSHQPGAPATELSSLTALPKITDFGLAKRLDLDAGQTPTVAFLGTPSYMAPEQASGQTSEVGPAADVYALGAILYEMLTGRPPFRGATQFDTLDQVRSLEPVPPSRYQPRVPRDLETICLKCLRKVPGQRYGSARELADDLHRFLAGKPIQARRTPWWEVAWKWARRNPALAALLLVSVSAAACLLILWARFTAELQTERDDALKQKQTAMGERDRADKEMKAAKTERDRADEQRRRAQDLLRVSLDSILKTARDVEKGREAKESEGTAGALYFVMGCAYAEAADTFRRDEKLPPADRSEFVERYERAALDMLRHADEKYAYFQSANNRRKLETDPRLKTLRQQSRFQEWLRTVRRN